ncbi:MAG: hypothetical protein RLZZ312_771 [Bacteroidota bacterium]
MMAFVGSSFGKNGILPLKTDLQTCSDSCQMVCHIAYNYARSTGADHATADAYGDLVYGNCIKSTPVK